MMAHTDYWGNVLRKGDKVAYPDNNGVLKQGTVTYLALLSAEVETQGKTVELVYSRLIKK